MWIILVIIIISAITLYRIYKYLTEPSEELKHYHESVDEDKKLMLITMEEAREKLLPLLADSNKFLMKRENIVLDDEFMSIAPGARSLIDEYHYIEPVNSEYIIGGNFVHRWANDPSFHQIGTGPDFTVLILKNGSEGVYELDNSDEESFNPNTDVPDYPSVYHMYLINH